LPQVAWYYGHAGPTPQDQEFIVKGNLMDQFQTTMDQFGPGGYDRAQWGGMPYEK